jgi:hypothetical protein
MAYCNRRHCPACQTVKDFWEGGGGPPRLVCSDCEGKANSEALQAHLTALEALPLEERLRRIETALYHLRPTTTVTMGEPRF